MVGAPEFSSWSDMQNSQWLENLKQSMTSGEWPLECQRCQKTENSDNPHSIRLDSIDRDKILSKYKQDYVILGGVLDNICNSACQSCNSNLSTKIGSLETKNYSKISNSHLFDQIPMSRVVEIDLNGGEPTASPEYQNLLNNLPNDVKVLRVNTNGSRLLPNIEKILERKIILIITLSLDGVGPVHDYVRWPIAWEKYTKTVDQYIQLRKKYNNLKLEAWTTVHSLNVENFDQIKDYVKQHNIDHSWAFLVNPDPLNPIYKNQFTMAAKHITKTAEIKEQIATGADNQVQLDTFIKAQDSLRNINIKDYL